MLHSQPSSLSHTALVLQLHICGQAPILCLNPTYSHLLPGSRPGACMCVARVYCMHCSAGDTEQHSCPKVMSRYLAAAGLAQLLRQCQSPFGERFCHTHCPAVCHIQARCSIPGFRHTHTQLSCHAAKPAPGVGLLRTSCSPVCCAGGEYRRPRHPHSQCPDARPRAQHSSGKLLEAQPPPAEGSQQCCPPCSGLAVPCPGCCGCC